MLGQLHKTLVHHFEQEEAAGGLYDVVAGVTPGGARCAGPCSRSTADLLAEVTTLVASPSDNQPRSLRSAAAIAFVDRLRGHEKRENRLLIEVLSPEPNASR